MKLKLILMHVETFSEEEKNPRRKVLKYIKIKDKLLLSPNKWEILPCMILQFAENWHKTVFNLGLKASLTSLVLIIIENIRVRYKLPNKSVHLWEIKICTFSFWTAAYIFNLDEAYLLKLALELPTSFGSASANEFLPMAKAKILKKRPFCYLLSNHLAIR